MKHIHFVIYALLAHSALHNMQKNKPVELWESIHWRSIENSLVKDYQSYVKHNLEKYKTTHFTLDDIVAMDNMLPIMTGKKDQLLLQNILSLVLLSKAI